jgi:nucleoside-diphosphate-sugar epimerase
VGRVAVTGGTGNVGSVLTDRLVAAGHEVVGLARRVPDAAGAGVEWRSVDLTRDGPELPDAVRGATAVVHLAWGFQPSHRLDHLEELGVGGTRRVLDAVAAERVPHLVHMSSVGVYSPRSGPERVAESYPRDGVPSSPYSRHKAAAERLLDDFEAAGTATTVTRLRPGIIGHRAAGSALLRYGVPGFVPTAALRLLPVLPLDRALEVPVVHADDVADAALLALEAGLPGALNLATGSPMTVELLAEALSARHVQIPVRVLRRAVDTLWRLRLQQVDPGWVDLGYAVPLMSTDRAEAELGWQPHQDTAEVVAALVGGLLTGDSAPTPVLRPRSVRDNLRRTLADGPVHSRARP